MNCSISDRIHRIGEEAVKALEEEYELRDLKAHARFAGRLLGQQKQLQKTTDHRHWFPDPFLENKVNEFQVCRTIIPCSHWLISIVT